MKKTLVCMLLTVSLCSFTKKKKKPEASFQKGNITAIVGTGWPNFYGYSRDRLVGPFFAAGEWQASKRWSFGLNYCYNYVRTGVETRTVYTKTATGFWVPSDTFLYKERVTVHAFMATAEYCYINKGRVCIGSGVGLGYMPQPTIRRSFPDGIDHSAQMSNERYLALAFRLRLIDAKVKINKNFGVCGGVGIGTDGILAIGATYTFTGKE